MQISFRVDVYLHPGDEVLTLLKGLKAQVEALKMSVSSDLQELSAKIDAATTAVAQRLDKLSQGIKNSMTDEEVTAIKASLQSEIDRLTVLGQDPANPVP